MPAETRSRSRRDRRPIPDRARRTEEAQQAAYEVARAVREAADARRDAEWRAATEANSRRLLLALLAPLVPGVIVTVLGIVVPVLFIVGAVLLVAAASLALVTWSHMTPGAVRAIGGLTLDQAVAQGSATALSAERYRDLTEQLCTTLGLPVPDLRVIDDRACNSLALGAKHGEAVVYLTTGLLGSMERIELEAVIAHELTHVKRLDSAAVAFELSALGKVVIGLGGERMALWLEGHERESAADLACVGVTRYPPGLRLALERVAASGDPAPSAVPEALRQRIGRAWLAPLGAGEPGSSVADRIDVLTEL